MSRESNIAEARCLNMAISNLDFLELIDEGLFSGKYKVLYKALCELKYANLSITAASLLQHAQLMDAEITGKEAEIIFNIETSTDFTETDFRDAVDTVKRARRKEEARAELHKVLDAFDESNISEEQIEDLKGKVENAAARLTSDLDIQKTMTMSQSFDEYLAKFEERKNGKRYKFYDYILDDMVTKGPEPGSGTAIFGPSGSGKSAYLENLIINLIDNRVPTLYYSLEMNLESVFDRLISIKTGIPLKEVIIPSKENFESIKEAVEIQRERLMDNELFRFSEAPSVWLSTIEADVRKFYSQTGVNYCIVAIDLVSMLKDFTKTATGNTATMIEFAMNDLNALAKALNFHYIALIQAGREAEEGKIKDLDDLTKYRPTRSNVKGSNSYLERARTLISLYRPKYWAMTYLPDQKEDWEDMDDVLEVSVLKQNSGSTGRRLAIFDTETMRVSPLVGEMEDL